MKIKKFALLLFLLLFTLSLKAKIVRDNRAEEISFSLPGNDKINIQQDSLTPVSLEKEWIEDVMFYLDHHAYGDTVPAFTNLGNYLYSSDVLGTDLKFINKNRENSVNGTLSGKPDISTLQRKSLIERYGGSSAAEKKYLKKKYRDIAGRAYKFPDKYIKDHFEKAESLLVKSTNFFPYYADAYLNLAKIYDEDQTPGKGIFYMQKLLKLSPQNKDAHMMLGLLLYRINKLDSSYSEYERAISLMSPGEKYDFVFNSSKQLLEPFLKDKPETMSPDSLNTIILKFWESGDPLFLTEFNERLLEHFARVSYADTRFSIPRLNIKGWDTSRGTALIRYGFPEAIIRLRGEMDTDVWLYQDKIFYFTDEYMNGDFSFGIPEMTAHWNAQNILLSQLKNQLPVVYKPEFENRSLSVPYNIVQFKSNLNNRTDLYVNYALSYSGGRVNNQKIDLNHEAGIFLFNKYFEPVFTRKIIQHPVDNNNNIQLDSAKYNINSLYVTSSPDSGRISFEIIRESDSAAVSNQHNFKIRDFSGNALQLSDIILAADISTGNSRNYPLTRGNITILPDPINTFENSGKTFLYYEIYNLGLSRDGSADFRQLISLQKKADPNIIGKVFSPILKFIGINNEEKKVSLTSDYHTNKKDNSVYLQLDMRDYEPGNYVLTVKIKDNISGKETEQSTELTWK